MLSLLDPRLWLALVIALAAAYGAGRWQQWRADEQAHVAALLQATEQARKIEHALQEKADGIRIEGEAARRRLVVERDRAIAGLRDRPEQRLPETATCTADGAGATGKQLSRPDAELLTRLAADADGVAADLRTCQAWVKALTAPR